MAAKKTTKPKVYSGPNIPDSQRHTKRLTLRVAPEVETQLRALARQTGASLADTVAKGLDLLAAERKGTR